MVSLYVWLLLAACASPVSAALDADAVEFGLILLAVFLLVLAVIALLILCCVCCRFCRVCQPLDICRPYNYIVEDYDYTTHRSDTSESYEERSRYTYRTKPEYRTRRSPERPWENRFEDFEYDAGYHPRHEQSDPRDPRRAVVVVKDLGYPPRPAIQQQQQVVTSRLVPGQVVIGSQYHNNGYTSQGCQSKQVDIRELKQQPWFNEVQHIINNN